MARNNGGAPAELLFNADIERDADGDGWGDETQDACLGVPGSAHGCPSADLSIATATTQDPGSNGNLTYTLRVRNNGPDTVPVSITDRLPPNVQLVGMGWDQGDCHATEGEPTTVTCSMGTGGAGATASITLVVQAAAGRIINTAAVSSPLLAEVAGKAEGAGDPNPANDSSTTTVTIAPPWVSGLRMWPGSWRPSFRLRGGARGGTTISFHLSEPATVALAFSQSLPGRRAGHGCRAPARRNRAATRCTRQVPVGSFSVEGEAGVTTVPFQGRLPHRRGLKPGRYAVTATATDAAGNSSQPRTSSFSVLR